MPMPPALLQVQGLTVRLPAGGDGIDVVRGVNFELAAGQSLGVVGESGCGKSMTALALLGLLPERAETGGVVRFDGIDLLHASQAQLGTIRGAQIGAVFQEPMSALNPLMRVGDQIGEPLLLHRRMSRRAARARAVELLDRVGIDQAARRVDAYPHQLSGGQRQRVMIAIALSCEPKLLIADEPTTALDLSVQRQILELIAGLVAERNMAWLLISHDLAVVSRYVAQVAVMYAGQFVEYGPTKQVFGHPAHPYTRGLLAARPRPLFDGNRPASAGGTPSTRLPMIAGAVPDPSRLPPGCAFAPRCPYAQGQCRTADLIEQPVEHGGAGKHRVRCIRVHEIVAIEHV